MGQLLAIEGVDGSGKNTQARLLLARAQAAGLRAASLAFPRYGKTLFAGLVADYLNGKFGPLDAVPPQLAALLYAGDRFESLAELRKLLADNDLVICDRYVASNLAYQSAKLPAPRRADFQRWVRRLEYEIYGLPAADLTLYLDVPVDTAARLMAQRRGRSYTDKTTDLHEADLEFLRATRQAYLDLSQSKDDGPWVWLSCVDDAGQMRTADDIAADIWPHVQVMLARSSMGT